MSYEEMQSISYYNGNHDVTESRCDGIRFRYTDSARLQQLNGAILSLLIGCVQYIRTRGLTSHLIQALDTSITNQRNLPEDASPLLRYQTAIAYDREIPLATGNEHLLRSFEQMETMLYLCTSLVDGKSDKSIEEHVAILEAIKKDQWEEIVDAFEKHYDKHLKPE